MKVAVVALLPSMVIVQGPLPVHAPLQPAKVELGSAEAVKVTRVPSVYVPVHVAPQLIPAGELVTLPVPVPARLTLKTLSDEVKVAVTLRVDVIATLQVLPVNESQPLQPVKVEFTSALAVKDTAVPSA